MSRFGIFILLSFLMFSISSFAQDVAFDKLELFYTQKHYKKVYKQSGKLLNNPEYDYSRVPTLYRALSTFQLSENKQWLKTRPHAIEDAKELYLSLLNSSDGLEVIDNHMVEIKALKQDLLNRISDLSLEGRQNEADQLKNVIAELFDNVPLIIDEKSIKVPPVSEKVIEEFTFDSKNRNEIIAFAKQQLGKPYVYTGTTPAGFDCSGFTSYVFSAYNIQLPRRSSEQYENAKKIKENKVQKGDLVFFDNGSGVNHVGIIISNQGENPVMIHASTSKGIVVTDIKSSDYWSRRIKGYGTFLD